VDIRQCARLTRAHVIRFVGNGRAGFVSMANPKLVESNDALEGTLPDSEAVGRLVGAEALKRWRSTAIIGEKVAFYEGLEAALGTFWNEVADLAPKIQAVCAGDRKGGPYKQLSKQRLEGHSIEHL
jgi:hypothetical protein